MSFFLFVRRMKVYPNSTILLRSDNRMREGKSVILRNQSILKWRELDSKVVGVDSRIIGNYWCWSNIFRTLVG